MVLTDCSVENLFVVASFIPAWLYIVTFVVISNGARSLRKDLSLKSLSTPTTGHFILSLHILISLFSISSGFLKPKLFTSDSFTKNSWVNLEGCKFLPATSCNLYAGTYPVSANLVITLKSASFIAWSNLNVLQVSLPSSAGVLELKLTACTPFTCSNLFCK